MGKPRPLTHREGRGGNSIPKEEGKAREGIYTNEPSASWREPSLKIPSENLLTENKNLYVNFPQRWDLAEIEAHGCLSPLPDYTLLKAEPPFMCLDAPRARTEKTP